MPAAFPPEFRRRAVELARERAKPITQICADVGVSESCLRRWLAQADVDEGKREGLSTSEREELARLRKENRVLKMERDLVSRAAAFRLGECPPEVIFRFMDAEQGSVPGQVHG